MRTYATFKPSLHTLLAGLCAVLSMAAVQPASADKEEFDKLPYIRIQGVLVNQGTPPPEWVEPTDYQDKREWYDEVIVTYTTYVPPGTGHYWYELISVMECQFLSILLTNPLTRSIDVDTDTTDPVPEGLHSWAYTFYVRMPIAIIPGMGQWWQYNHYYYAIDARLNKLVAAPLPSVVSLDSQYSVDLWRKRATSMWLNWEDYPIQSP